MGQFLFSFTQALSHSPAPQVPNLPKQVGNPQCPPRHTLRGLPQAQPLQQHLESWLCGQISSLHVNTQSPTQRSPAQLLCRAGLTLMGEYHFRGDEGRRMLLPRFLGSGNSYSCSGIFTLAFLAFSNLAPSSVEPFSPQRTWKEG